MRASSAAVLVLVLSGCAGGGAEKMAADACAVEVNQRLTGKSYELDVGQLQSSAAANGNAAGTLQLTAPIVFDRGLASEFTQVLKCKVRVDAKAATVISLEFIWSMEDLKKAE